MGASRSVVAILAAGLLVALSGCTFDVAALRAAVDGSAAPPPDGAPAPDGPPAPDGARPDAAGPGDGSVVRDGAAAAGDVRADVPLQMPPGDGDAGPSPPDAPPGPCVPQGPESCFNGADDDCNGQVDCADPACRDGNQCVPVANGVAGFVLTSGDCPAGLVEVGLGTDVEPQAQPCAGCECKPPAAYCTGDFRSYHGSECQNNALPQGGELFGLDSRNMCADHNYPAGTMTGGQLHPLSLHQDGGCTVAGTPTRIPTRLRAVTRFCAAQRPGAGCPAGQVCMAKPPVGVTACALMPGRVECPASMTRIGGDLFAGVQDGRTCGACSCGEPSGGDCNGVYAVARHAGCGSTGFTYDFRPGQRQCLLSCLNTCGPGYYMISPGLWLAGSPTPGTRQARSEVSGTAAPSDPKTICCVK